VGAASLRAADRGSQSLTRAELQRVVVSMEGRRILALADLVADEFVHGRVERISREAPVLILTYEGADLRPGGGANAVHNMRTLGGWPIPVGVVGADDHGRRLRGLLKQAGVSVSHVLTESGYPTPLKTRVLGGGTHSTEQQIVRLDRVVQLPRRSRVHERLRQALAGYRGRVDGVLVTDYGIGLVTPGLVRAAVRFARERGVPVTIDSRHALLSFRGMTAVTPNEPEVEAAIGVRIGHDRRRLEMAGAELLSRLRTRAVLITRGSDGMSLFEVGQPPRHIPVYGTDQVADVTGAGDTVIATFTLALAAGATPLSASLLANYAGGIVVMKRGTATVSAAELLRAIAEDPSRP
jgi:D-glycero-beta-D-manno-heptose-7-phosphate kinase